jgi:hypothetical protein
MVLSEPNSIFGMEGYGLERREGNMKQEKSEEISHHHGQRRTQNEVVKCSIPMKPYVCAKLL